jgi:hypothetical protein
MPDRSRTILTSFEREHCDLVHSNVEAIGEDDAVLEAEPMRALFHRTTDLARSAVDLGLLIGATGAIHRRLFDRCGSLPEGTYEALIFGFHAILEGARTILLSRLSSIAQGSG